MTPSPEDVPRVKLDDAERLRLAWRNLKREFFLESVGQFTEKQAAFLWRWMARTQEISR